MLLYLDDDEKVAGRAAGRARFAFVLQPELLAVRDTRRNFYRDLPFACDRARAVTGCARLRDDAARATALRTRPRDGEKALLKADLAVAFALRTGARRLTGRCARSTTGRAMFVARNLNGGLGSPR